MSHRPVVVVPTKDNLGTIEDVVRRCRARLEDVIVVDDGCTDGTAEVARGLGVVVLSHGTNRGKGAALLTAFRWAAEHGYTHAVTIDADGQHIPEEIDRFVEASRAEPTAIIAGARDMRTAPELSRFGRGFSNFWIWVETGWSIEDSQCGFRVYPIAPVLALGLHDSGYELEVDVLVRGLWSGMPVLDLPCDVYYPPAGERVTSFQPVWDPLRITLLNIRLLAERVLWPPRWRRHPALRTDTWRDTHRGAFWAWWLVVMIIRWTGRWPAYVLATFLAGWFAVFAAGPRRAILRYGGRLGRGRLRSGWLVLRVFHAFALSLVDRFLLLTRGADSFDFERAGLGPAYAELEAERGLLVLSAHIGNPDLGAACLHGRIPRPVNVLQYAGPDDPYIRLAREIAPSRAPNVIALNDEGQHASIQAIRALRRGEVVAMKADRVVDERYATVPFLGRDIRLPTGPFIVAAVSQAPFVMLGCFKEGPRRYRVVATEPRVLSFTGRETRDADLQRWAAELAQQLEVWAKAYPEQWFNFHDSWAGEDD